MTPKERARINTLHELLGDAQQALGEIVKHAGKVAEAGGTTDEQWERIFAAQKSLADLCGKLGDALKQAAKDAKVPIDD
ncbi:MAG: hypothetical protein KDJ36_07315 [Hyphomicrobiaceae bacterium]|nr:hypothetical protein [Hyphomicrobiaceae bacterium]